MSISVIVAGFAFAASGFTSTWKEVDLTVIMHGSCPMYRTVHRAFPAYIGLKY
jgi:hypothetical protein